MLNGAPNRARFCAKVVYPTSIVRTLPRRSKVWGGVDKREIESRLSTLLLHLLKWQFQAERRKTGWLLTIREQRHQIKKLINESPSLKAYPRKQLASEFEFARLKAADETGLPEKDFPADCSLSDCRALLDHGFSFPGAPWTSDQHCSRMNYHSSVLNKPSLPLMEQQPVSAHASSRTSAIVLGMVIGLGVTRLAVGWLAGNVSQSQYRLYSVHLAWSLCRCSLMLVHFWWWEFGLFQIETWTFGNTCSYLLRRHAVPALRAAVSGLYAGYTEAQDSFSIRAAPGSSACWRRYLSARRDR